MASYEDENRTVISKLIVLLILTAAVEAGLTSVAVAPKSLNAIATYSWTIAFNAGATHNPLTLTFPNQVTILPNVTVTIGSIGQNFSVSSNVITITSSISVSSISVVVGNVQNPSSAISTSAFSYFNTADGTVSLDTFTQVQYEIGSLTSCTWSFSLCTEQPSSDLLIPITTVNKLSVGNKYFLIGYGPFWTNHYSKGLVTSIGTLTCSYSIDNGATYTPGTSCTVDSLNSRIAFLFSVSGSPIGTGTSIIVKVSGVNAPPTMVTSTNSNYFIYTADSSQVRIDGMTSCPISNTCITNQTTGTFSNTTMRVNGNYGNPNITFPLTPLTITIQPSDTIDIYYSPISSLLTCSTLSLYRSGSPLYTLTTPTSGSSSITFAFPSNNGYNTEYTYPVYTYLQCSAFLLPPSETPVTLAFIFKRNSDTYLHLNTTITASATTFNSSKGNLALSSNAMVANAGYTFNFLIGQKLGSTPAITLTFPTDFVIVSPTCSVSILSLTISSSSCSFINATNTMRVALVTTASSIPSSSNFTIVINGITNPSSPKAYSIAMNTYFDSTIATSRVETSTTAFSATITEITNYPIVLSPSGLTVYSSTNIVLAFTPIITIPIFSTFYVQFPSNVSNLLPTTGLLMVGGVSKPLNGSLLTTTTTVTFSSGVQIAAGSNVTITVPLTTPSNIGTYSYVKLIVSNNSTRYLSSLSSLYLNVNSVNSMSVTITAITSMTGATSAYKFDLSLTIPHSTTFIVEVDVPTDTKFLSSNASCTSCVNNTLAPVSNTSFSFTANNPTGTNSLLISFTISSFTNPRSVGNSLSWGIATKTTNPVNLISYTTNTADIKNPNSLAASLAKNESYYRSNTSPVKMTIGFFNQLTANDSILLSFTSDSYTASSVACSSIYGVCSVVGTPSNVTVIKIIPNTTSIISNSLFLILEGLTSAAGTAYAYSTSITVTTLNSAGALIDSGSMVYNISCGLFPDNRCKQCYNNGTCINCYPGNYLQGNACFSSCGSITQYMSYASNSTGTCVTCINNCATCDTDTLCRTCIPNYYYFTTDSSCRLICPTTSGYYISTADGFCRPCVSNCLECVNGSNTCTRCDNITLLISGICQSGCGSTNYYQLNGNCVKCDDSCSTCTGAGSGNCIACNVSYHMYRTASLTQCVQTCPNGTAVDPATSDCGCSPECQTCSTYTSCTKCTDTSLWAMNGVCIGSCSNATYPKDGQCISCTSQCSNCTDTTCISCYSGNYLFNNTCWSDCNSINQQYDVFGNSCVLCPTGCDFCSGTTCTACLQAYTLVGTQCTKTCLLSNTCDTTAQVLPLPGLLSLVVWVGITVVIHILHQKNYMPYSVILLSGVIQFVLVLALISSVSSPASRLLASGNAYQTQMKGLLGGAIAVNYLENIAYLVIFIYYIKPLITNPRQIDVISNVVVLLIGTVTNFRFGLVAFARLFPKPNIYVLNASKLTPIHYLCLISLVFDLLPLVACGLGLINSQKLSNTFMLSLDLLIVIVINMAITIWFVAASKPDSYFQDLVKKYHTEDNVHNPTDETLPNEKNLSKANMVGNQSINFDDFDRTENDDSYNKFTPMKVNNSSTLHNLNQQSLKENPLPITVSKIKKNPDPFVDPNFEDNIKSKRSNKLKDSMVISKADFGKSIDKEGKSVDQNLSARKSKVVTGNFGKDPKSERKRVEPQKNIVEVEESDYPDLEEKSSKEPNPNKVFNSKQRIAKPKKVKQSKGKAIEQPMKVMKKGDKRIGYFQSDAYDSNVDGQDLEEIIKQKIWQSTIKLQKPSIQSGREEQTAHQEISPSWFNAQNQRLDITDLEDADPQ